MSGGAAANTAETAWRTPRWIWILLILSLALNLLILGIVFGSLWAVRHGGLWDAPVVFERSQRFMQGLPDDRRDEIKTVFFNHKPGLAPYWREVRDARISVGRLIKTGGNTAEQLNTALDNLFRKEMAAREAAKPMIADMVGRLQPSERLHFLSVFLPYLDELQAQPSAQAAP